MTMTWSSLPFFRSVRSEIIQVCARIERTLERIDVEALVAPVEFFIFESLLDGAPLCIVRGDDPVRNILLLEVFRDDRDGLDLTLVLVTTVGSVSFHCNYSTHHIARFIRPSFFGTIYINETACGGARCDVVARI